MRSFACQFRRIFAKRLYVLRHLCLEKEMKKCADLLPLFAALLFLSSSTLVLAGGGKKAKTPEYHDTVIESVSPASLVVSTDREKRTYPVNQFTGLH